MKRMICICLAAVMAMPVIFSQSLKFENTVYDFGQVVDKSGPLECCFKAVNTSTESVTVQSVSTSCGCTNVKWTREAIAPGKPFTIRATYSNDEGPYAFDKTLTVKVTGEAKPVILHIRGLAVKEILPDSQVYKEHFTASLGMCQTLFKCPNLEQGSSKSDQTTVANLSASPIKVTFENIADGLELSVKPNPIPAKGHATLHYTVSSREDKWGFNDYTATPVVDGKSSERSFSVRAFTSGNFSTLTKEQRAAGSRPVIGESTFSFGHKKQGSVVNAFFKIENKGQSPLKVYKVDIDSSEASFEKVPELAPGRSTSFGVRLDTRNLPKGEALVIVTLTTNSPARPIVNLFIAGWID